MIHISQAALEQVTKIFDRRKAAVGLSGYTVGALLDQGSMSNVYRIVDQSGNTDYVLRVSEEHKSSYSNDIFNVREMEILRELKKSSQPHVVQYLDAFAIDIPGQPRYYCAVMKFLRTLIHEIKTAEACQVFHQSLQQMQDLRQTPRLFEKIRRVPYMLQKPFLCGSDPRR